MADGRRGTAPCGHEGVYIVGQYVACQRCDRAPASDGIPEEIEAEGTRPICTQCGSGETEPFMRDTFLDTWRCVPCGKVLVV